MAHSITEVQKTLRAHKVSYSWVASTGDKAIAFAVTPMTLKKVSPIAVAKAERGAAALRDLGYHASVEQGTLVNGKRFAKLVVRAGRSNPSLGHLSHAFGVGILGGDDVDYGSTEYSGVVTGILSAKQLRLKTTRGTLTVKLRDAHPAPGRLGGQRVRVKGLLTGKVISNARILSVESSPTSVTFTSRLRNPKQRGPSVLAHYGASRAGTLAEVAELRRAGKTQEAYRLMSSLRKNPHAGTKTPVGTRLRLVKDIVDIRRGKKVTVARKGDRGVTIDQDKLSDWPKVRLDNGKRIIVDMEDGEAVVDTTWVAPVKARRNPTCANPHKVGDAIVVRHAQGTWRGTVKTVGDKGLYLVGARGGTAHLVRNVKSGRLSALVVVGKGMPRSYAVQSIA